MPLITKIFAKYVVINCYNVVEILIDFKEEQDESVSNQIIVSLFESVNDIDKEEEQNTHSSVVVILFGKVNEIREYKENTKFSIVILSLITIFLICSLFEYQRVVYASPSLINT